MTGAVNGKREVGAATGRGFFTAVTALGWIIFAAGAVFLVLNGLIQGLTAVTVVGLIFTLVALAVAGLVWRFGGWALIVAAVLAVLSLVANFSTIAHGLRTPNSAFDFIPALFTFAGNLMALAGGIIGFMQRRRGVEPAATPDRRRAVSAILAALAALAALSGVLTLTSRSSVSAEQKAGAITVDMKATEFSPETVELEAGETARVLVKNSDPSVHTFTVKDLGVNVGVLPGSEKVVELRAPAAGSYKLTCEVPGHEAMTGTVEVR